MTEVDEGDRFLVDVMCGRLVTYLRMCGYDTRYVGDEPAWEDATVLEVATRDHRVLLTRDTSLADQAGDWGLLIESTDPHEQLRELARAGVELEPRIERCSTCNGVLSRVPQGATTPEWAPSPSETDVWRCTECGQLYWRGSHWDDVVRRLSELE